MHKVQIADGDDSVSVRHRKCCGTLFSGRLTLLILLRVAVSQGSTLLLRTMFGVPRGAKAAAEAGRSVMGMSSTWMGVDGS